MPTTIVYPKARPNRFEINAAIVCLVACATSIALSSTWPALAAAIALLARS